MHSVTLRMRKAEDERKEERGILSWKKQSWKGGWFYCAERKLKEYRGKEGECMISFG